MATGDLRLDAIETPEGRAIYPFGAWGAGYLVDDATERRLHTYLGRILWVLMGFFMLQGIVRELIFPVPELVALAVTYTAFLVFHYAVVKAILRGTARASFRPSSEELLRLRLARGGRTAMIAAHWCGLVAFGAIGIGVGIVTEGRERSAVVAGCARALFLLAVNLRRVQRIPD